MASTAKSRRRRRGSGAGPRAVASTRRSERAARQASTESQRRRSARGLGTEGERPLGVFGRVPVSEAAILGGLICAVVGFSAHDMFAIVTGLVICGLAVMEVAGREHFTGFRSHSALLAAIPTVGIEVLVVALFGDPSNRAWLILVIVPVFAVLFWSLRHRFQIARQTRVTAAARGVSGR